MNTQKRSRLIMRSCLLVILTVCVAAVQVPVPAQAGPIKVFKSLMAAVLGEPTRRAEKATNKDELQTFAVLTDQAMAEIRGCYDAYYFFGMNVDGTIDFAGGKPTITGNVTTFAFSDPNHPIQQGGTTLPNGGFSFTAGNGQVAFTSSFGSNPNLGNGVIQLVQVAGNNNLIIASTNVSLYLNNLPTIKPGVTNVLGGVSLR